MPYYSNEDESLVNHTSMQGMPDMIVNANLSDASGGKCGSSKSALGCSGNKDLLPMHLSSFNVREIVKQMLLLEDHLYHPAKRCQECIAKHFLMVEALAEEGVTLESEDKSIHDILKAVAIFMRKMLESYQRVRSHETSVMNIVSNIRILRKYLMKAGNLY